MVTQPSAGQFTRLPYFSDFNLTDAVDRLIDRMQLLSDSPANDGIAGEELAWQTSPLGSTSPICGSRFARDENTQE